MTGVRSCSSCVAEKPACALSTIATGATIGEMKVRAPGLAVVQVAAAPPPVPPSTTVQKAGMPREKSSLSMIPGPEVGRPTVWLKVLLQLPWAEDASTRKLTVLPQARLG